MMNAYTLEVKVRVMVHVRAMDETTARKLAFSVLGPPGNLEIGLANENNAALGLAGTVTAVDFVREGDASVVHVRPG